MAKVFKFYYDLMSQPSRALWIGFKLGKTSYQDCPVALRKREQLTEAYKAINRFQKVPCIVDGDFHLAESVAILRYLSDKGQFSEALYPKDLKKRSRVDEFLEWHHLSLRLGCGMYFMNLWLLPMRGLAPKPSPEEAASLKEKMELNLGLLEKYWLNNSQFLMGDHLTIADLFGACEITQTRLLGYDVSEKFPIIGDWLSKVNKETNPYFDDAHLYINKQLKK